MFNIDDDDHDGDDDKVYSKKASVDDDDDNWQKSAGMDLFGVRHRRRLNELNHDISSKIVDDNFTSS